MVPQRQHSNRNYQQTSHTNLVAIKFCVACTEPFFIEFFVAIQKHVRLLRELPRSIFELFYGSCDNIPGSGRSHARDVDVDVAVFTGPHPREPSSFDFTFT